MLSDLQLSKLKKELRGKVCLVTGGAGSIGSLLVERLLAFPVHSVRVLDTDENAIFKLQRKLQNPKFRPLLGNILNKDRVELASEDVDYIFHVAAIKNIEISEFNPIETIDTNINGTVNLLKISFKMKPKKFLNVSTDKVVESTTLYGATKLLGEKLTSWAGVHNSFTKFGTVRFGNVMESRGNVFEIWNDEVKNKVPLSITDKKMKRYFWHSKEAVDFILKSFLIMNNGEIFVPKMKLYNIYNLSKKISKNYKIIGLRPGEKMSEELLTNNEKNISKEKSDMWIIPAKF